MSDDNPNLPAIAARAAAATPGPWPVMEWHGTEEGGWAAIGPHHLAEDDEDDSPESPSFDRARADAIFIAHARTDIPALLSALSARDADLAAAAEREQRHLELIRKLTQTTPLDSEIAAALEQRGALLAEVGSLRSVVAELGFAEASMQDEVNATRAENARLCTLIAESRDEIREAWSNVDSAYRREKHEDVELMKRLETALARAAGQGPTTKDETP